MPRPLRVATRGSELARWQARRVAAMLGGDVELLVITTTGDTRTDVPIHAVGGTGIFVKEVQQAVLDERADLAVHSAKDLPASAAPEGIVLAAVPERNDPRDALVGSTLDALPAGGRVGTGSVRRRAQLAALRPDLTFGELRGNVPTRVERAGEFDAIVVAAAALERLGLEDRAAEILDPSVMLPQVGQGALAVECRTDDAETRERLAAIDDTSAARGSGSRARLPRPARRWVRPSLWRTGDGRGRRDRGRGAAGVGRRSAWCCDRRPAPPARSPRGSPRPPTCSITVDERSSTSTSRRTRPNDGVPGGRGSG